MTRDTDLIAAALVEMFGERCPDFDPGCMGCRAWAEFDRLTVHPVQEPPSPPPIAMEPLGADFEAVWDANTDKLYEADPPSPGVTAGATGAETFQGRVQPWMQACFGPEVSADRLERGDRLLEEVFELLQSGGYPRERVASLTGYVWSRPTGEPAQEVGGVMVTLAAYCLAHGLDMHSAGETELARIWTKVEAIRAKQAAKPKGSALPQEWPTPAPVVPAEGLDALVVERVEMEDWSLGYAHPADPIWRIVINRQCADFPSETAARNFAAQIAALRSALSVGARVTVQEAARVLLDRLQYSAEAGFLDAMQQVMPTEQTADLYAGLTAALAALLPAGEGE